MIKNKRGDVSNIPVFMIILFFLAISFIVGVYTNDIIKDVINDPKMETSVTDTISGALITFNETTVQQAFVFAVAIMIIVMFISAFLVRIHPVFFFIYLLVLSFTLFMSVFISNIYHQFISVEQIANIASKQPMINYFMEHMVIIVLVVGIMSLIVTFAKKPSSIVGREGVD